MSDTATKANAANEGIRTNVPKSYLWPFKKIPNYQRLVGEVETTNEMVTQLSGKFPEYEWERAAKSLLAKTEASIRRRDQQRAWITLKAAQRHCLFGMEKPEVKSLSLALEREAVKIESSWRKKAIQRILQEVENEDSTLSADKNALFAASSIRDEHFDNFWRNVDRRINTIAASVVFLVVLTFIIVVFWDALHTIKYSMVYLTSVTVSLPMVVLFGALGGALSATQSLVSTPPASKFIDGALNPIINLSRPIIGAASAVAILFFYAGDLLDDVLKIQLGPNAIYVIAFTSGFSERLIFSATSKISGKAEGNED